MLVLTVSLYIHQPKLIGLKTFMLSAPPFLGTNRIKMALKILAQKNLAEESLARILFPQLALKPPTNLSKSYCQTIMLQGCPHLGLDKATKTS